MNAIDQVVLQKETQRRDPEFAVPDVSEEGPRKIDMACTEWRLALGSNFRRHPPVDFDHRVVSQRVNGVEPASGFQRAADLGEQSRLVGDMMNRIGDIGYKAMSK